MKRPNISFPTEDELRERIVRHLSWRGDVDSVALIWHGYLTGLVEWGLIELNVFERLTSLLPKLAERELVELSLDEPISAEMEKEIEKARGLREDKK